MMQTMPNLEIAVTSLVDALRAQEGGADSVEISHDLSVGGLTPALDLVRDVRDALTIDIHVIIRPHARSFVYTPDEQSQILEQIAAYAETGINGLVFGALRADDHRVDLDLMRRAAHAGAPRILTLHRALDESAQADESIQALSGTIPRILTSGPAANAWDGREGLRTWVQTFGSTVRFVASGGLTVERLSAYAAHVGAHEYHFGGAARTNGAVDVEKVKRLREILARIHDERST